MKAKKIVGGLIVLAVLALWLVSSIIEYGVFEGVFRCLTTIGITAAFLVGLQLLFGN